MRGSFRESELIGVDRGVFLDLHRSKVPSGGFVQADQVHLVNGQLTPLGGWEELELSVVTTTTTSTTTSTTSTTTTPTTSTTSTTTEPTTTTTTTTEPTTTTTTTTLP